MANDHRIVVIDDDNTICDIVSAVAATIGFDCATTKDSTPFQDLITPDTTLILLDLMMPELDGIEVLRLLGGMQCKARILLMSGMDKRVLETAEKLAHSLGLQVIGHLQKPVPVWELRATLESVAATSVPAPKTEAPHLRITDGQLKLALERDEFFNFYQPQISLLTGDVIGVEALARWKHPERGIVLPEHFIARIE